MPRVAEADKVGNIEFKWGKQRGVGGKKKEVKFYESFTYDGVEYTLHDCVYMHKEGEPEPYIGKLIKIWENPDKTKKVKVQWFFCPSEILNWLGDDKALENEIFLASGEGVGLANVNPLEAIAGKCNVVCISHDSRNPQPSEEEHKMADYVFYRTFNVEHFTILDKLDDKVGGLESKFLFNRKESENVCVPKHGSNWKDDNKNAIGSDEALQLSSQNPPEDVKTLKTDGNYSHLVTNVDADVKDLLVKWESLPGDAKDLFVTQGSLPVGKPASEVGMDSSEVATTNMESGSVLGKKTIRCKVDSNNEDVEVSKAPVNEVVVEEGIKSAIESDAFDDRPSKKARIDYPIKPSEDMDMNSVQKFSVHGNFVKALETATSEEKTKSEHGKDSLGTTDKGVKSAKDSGDLENRPSKKARVDSSFKLSEDRSRKNDQKLNINSDGNDSKDLVASVMPFGGRTKFRLTMDSLGPNKVPPEKEKSDEKTRKLSNGKLPKVSHSESADEDRETEGQVFEVTRGPDADKSKWFRELPWEERTQSAHEQGTLALLQNLDPKYTSGEVEDIIWHALKENCAVKMVQRTTISSPHSGQAFAIFKTREATERVIRKLDERCLMLTNGRPLVGSTQPPPILPGKQSTFVGHLFIDKIKLQTQREMKDAVSTSHCSQPNTIEYEMAMEWCLLQSRSDSWWKRLYKQQGNNLRKLKANLKSK